jgi:hypothetical protein
MWIQFDFVKAFIRNFCIWHSFSLPNTFLGVPKLQIFRRKKLTLEDALTLGFYLETLYDVLTFFYQNVCCKRNYGSKYDFKGSVSASKITPYIIF